MSEASISVSLLTLLVSFTQVAAQECKTGWTYFDGNCYGYSDTTVSWTEAASICSLLDSRLVEVETREENNFITQLLTNVSAPSRVWLGGTDIFGEGNWIWVSKRSHIYPYSNWHHGQPSDSHSAGEDCLAMSASYHYEWDDEECSRANNFICEQQYTGDGDTFLGTGSQL